MKPTDPPTEEEIAASMTEPLSVEEAAKQALEEDKAEETPPAELIATPQPPKVALNTKTINIEGVEYNELEVAEAIRQSKKNKAMRLALPEDAPSKPGMMLLGKCMVKYDNYGSTVPKTDLTPAEVMLLAAQHHRNAGGIPILGLEITGEIARTPAAEARRLRNIYGDEKVKVLFPGGIPQLPQTFSEAIQYGSDSEVPSRDLVRFEFKALKE